MENFLAFDCSGQKLSVLLKTGEKKYINIREVGLHHSEKLMPLINSMCNEAGISSSMLELIACPKGPGSFTGLRIAMATAKGLSLALNIPLVCVATTSYLALKAPSDYIVIPFIDAKKNRYYASLFYDGRELTPPLDISIENLLPQILSHAKKENCNKIFLTSEDAKKALTEIQTKLSQMETKQQEMYKDLEFILDLRYDYCGIESLLELAVKTYKKEGPTPLECSPLYLRKSEAEENFISCKEN